MAIITALDGRSRRFVQSEIAGHERHLEAPPLILGDPINGFGWGFGREMCSQSPAENL
jgi:hypothetical protein